ncbi:ABC transporter ATP-binding protein [Clostridium sporogenes]
MVKKKQGIARLFEIAGEKKMLLVVSSVLSTLSAVMMLAPFLAVYKILEELLLNIKDLSGIDKSIMMQWGWIAFGCLIIGLLFMYGSLMSSHVAAFRILYGLRVKLAKHLGKLSLGYLSGTSTGVVKKTLEQNVEKIEKFVAHTIPDLVNVTATVIILIISMFYLNVWMTLVCIVAYILGFGIQASLMFGEKARKNMKAYYDSLEQVNASAVQYVRGMPAVKIFGQTVFSFRKLSKDMNNYRDFSLKFTDEMQNGFIFFKVLVGSLLTFVLPVGLLIMSGEPDSLAFALTYLFFIVMMPGASAPIFKMTMLASSTRDINEGVLRIDNIFAEVPMKESEHPMHPENHNLEFQNVTFSYDLSGVSTRTEALKDVSFNAKMGKVTALVGPSGSGKSTIANLIPRFWDVSKGSIKIGDVDIRNIKTEELMNIVSFVFQDTFLFYDSLYENIKVGNPNATKEEVIKAAKAAQCHEFIENLPKGYDTLIGEGGIYLSGGEEQRVSVARAILKNAPILVLDEATAFADPENEHKMQLALTELIKNKTVIIIAHRLSSIKEADQILVMENGSIVEKGTHEELCNLGGLYKGMWDAYTDAYDWTLKKGGIV